MNESAESAVWLIRRAEELRKEGERLLLRSATLLQERTALMGQNLALVADLAAYGREFCDSVEVEER